jgi:hypothetical protein
MPYKILFSPRLLTVLLALVVAFGLAPTHAQDNTRRTVGTITGTHEGYTLYTPTRTNNVYLIDDQGRVVNEWEVAESGRDAFLRENGNLVVSMRKASIEGDAFTDEMPNIAWSNADGRFAEYTWDGELVWMWEFDRPGFRVHHGIEVLPNGNILFMVWEYIPREDAIAAGRNPATLEESLWPDTIFEYSPAEDAIVWEWRAWDHLIQDFDPAQANYGDVAANPGRIDVNYYDIDTAVPDWMHSNAIDYNPDVEQIMLNVRDLNEIWIIDHSISTEAARGPAGDVLYRWGNPEAYRMGAAEDQQFGYGHDAQWVPAGYPGAGNIILYSNRHTEDGTPIQNDPHHSAIIEFTPPLQPDGTYFRAAGEPFGPAAPTWVYDGLPDNRFISTIISGVQRLPNGNTLIIAGTLGRLFEVTPAGDVAWNYQVPVNDTFLVPNGGRSGTLVFRARRYMPDFPAFATRELSPGPRLEDRAATSPADIALIESGRPLDGVFRGDLQTRHYTFATECSAVVSVETVLTDAAVPVMVDILTTDGEVLQSVDGSGALSISGFASTAETRYLLTITRRNSTGDLGYQVQLDTTPDDADCA